MSLPHLQLAWRMLVGTHHQCGNPWGRGTQVRRLAAFEGPGGL
jgi:hypothetical protein